MINVASHCGYTESNYAEFRLLKEFRKDGFEIILFPCDQFGRQEPGGPQEIVSFARSKGFEGMIMQKGGVEGFETGQVFRYLKQKSGKTQIAWNFDGKFVVNRDGSVVAIPKNQDVVEFIRNIVYGDVDL